jgi:hypothetical protein
MLQRSVASQDETSKIPRQSINSYVLFHESAHAVENVSTAFCFEPLKHCYTALILLHKRSSIVLPENMS